MKKIIYSILSLALALSIIVVSCGKSGGYNSMTTNPPPAAAANNTVNIVNMAFSPLTINVAAGTTVNWYNGDTMAHTVTADDASFDSGNIEVGGRYSKQFSTPGTYAYHCTIHPAMKATVVVK